MKPIDNTVQPIQCDECQVGKMSRTYITYFTWIGDELISVPDFPAWVCDMCGRSEYDLDAVSRMSLLLNPVVGDPISKTYSLSTSTDHEKARPHQTDR